MRKALAQWGHKISEVELQHLMAIADVDGDGLIDYNEFVAATMHLSKLEKEELLQQAFKQIDKDGSGTISVQVRQGGRNGGAHRWSRRPTGG